ncbi:alpha/beta hydrolase [Streptomyces sp. 8N616]|uniref:alpha/beta hydrolase n=1 Tax=Streptomyces sp. 8N616 TaxID=3457414 RepID=UPI003FD5BB23
MAAVMSLPPVPADATVAYGEHPDQLVDFYAPRVGEGPAPLVVVLHGGAWRAPYDRQHISPFAAHLAAHGFAVASVEYRRGPADEASDLHQEMHQAAESAPLPGGGRASSADSLRSSGTGAPPDVAAVRRADQTAPSAGRWPETLDDVAVAIDRIPESIHALTTTEAAEAAQVSRHARPDQVRAGWGRVDTACVVLVGHSAGGHLALWAAARHRQPVGSPWHRTSPPPVRGVVALAPLADFASARALGACSDAVVQFLGGPGEYAARQPYADPAALLPTGIATTIVQGATDNDVPPQVARAFASAAERAGEPVRLVVLDGAGHFPLIDPARPEARTVTEEIGRLAR